MTDGNIEEEQEPPRKQYGSFRGKDGFGAPSCGGRGCHNKTLLLIAEPTEGWKQPHIATFKLCSLLPNLPVPFGTILYKPNPPPKKKIPSVCIRRQREGTSLRTQGGEEGELSERERFANDFY